MSGKQFSAKTKKTFQFMTFRLTIPSTEASDAAFWPRFLDLRGVVSVKEKTKTSARR